MNKLLALACLAVCLPFSALIAQTPTNAIADTGKVGVYTTSPTNAIQVGNFGNAGNYKIQFPGVYNFEQANLGMYNNGDAALEFVNHASSTASYGFKLGCNVDTWGNGFYINAAAPATSYSGLSYLSTPAIFINTGNNVGIGTTSPAYSLHVVSNGNTAAASSLLWGQYFGAAIGVNSTSSSYYAFEVEGNLIASGAAGSGGAKPLFFVSAGGNVGVGTNSPTSTLSVAGNVDIPGGHFFGYALSNAFTYQGVTVPYYGQSWIQDNTYSNGPSFWLSAYGHLKFFTNGLPRMQVSANGNVGIGTLNPQSLLAVEGNVTAQQVTVTQTGWSDFVFDSAYQRMSLDEVASYVRAHKHLPDVPSASEIESKGLDLGAMEKLHMQKIEELTLYLVEQQKQIDRQSAVIEALEKRVADLESKK